MRGKCMNRSTKRLGISLLLIACCALTPLFAVELDQLMSMAKEQSPQMQAYRINRQNSEITNTLSDTKDAIGIEVSSGNTTVAYTPETTVNMRDKNGNIVPITNPGQISTSASPSITITLPNDGKTKISVGAGAGVDFLDTGARSYSLSPAIGASHTFTFGETGDSRSDLLYTQNELIASQTYSTNVLNFENQVYQKISSILTLEQQLRSTQKNIDDLQTSMDNAIKLGTTSKDSVTYRNQEIQLESYKNSLDNIKLSYQYNLDQYKALTGLAYEPVTGIREVSLNFSPLSAGNTSVILKQLSLEIAQEDLKLENAKQSNTTLGVNGSVGVPVTRKSGQNSYSVNGTAGATLAGSNFSVAASTKLDYSITDSKFSPSVTVAGTWKNNASKTSDTLKLQQLENKVLLAQLDYNDALLSYQSSAISLQNEVQNWNLSMAQQKNMMDYHQQVLAQKETLLEKGLGKQSDVDAAKFTIAQDQYDWDKLLLDGLVLENKIRMIQL